MTAAVRDPATGRFQKAPDTVEAGGRIWTAAEDGHPLGALIGYELALLHGTAVPVAEAQLVDLAKKVTT